MEAINIENVNNELSIENKDDILSKQNNALSEILNNVINWSIDAGLKYILPDSIENDVIKIKNDLLNGNAAQKIIDTIGSVINLGKEKLNNEKKEIINTEDIKKVLQNPDTIKLISDTVETILNNRDINIQNKERSNKKIIEKNVENNLNNQLESQINSINKIENYKNEWYKNYENKDFEKINKVYKNIKKELKNIVPIEKLIKETRKIENLNQLIKSKGGDFNITKEELELANKLV